LVQSQDSLPPRESRRSLDLTVNGVGLSVGDSRRVTGLRLNFRDTRLDRVNGINATIWHPEEGGAGDIHGMALGIPSTGGRTIKGLSLGILGVSAEEKMSGIGIGGIGLGLVRRCVGSLWAGLGWEQAVTSMALR
jgi:hypothetical protein